MNLAELKEAYKAKKLAFDTAKKEEEKYKALLKDAMLEAGESDYTDEAGYRFERIVQERKSMDEEKLLAELHERNLTSCIATKEVVDEDATLKAVEAGELPQEVLADEIIMRAYTQAYQQNGVSYRVVAKKGYLNVEEMGKVVCSIEITEDTMMNNIRMGNQSATDEQVIEAAKKAHCHEFIEKLPQGYQTIISEGSASLSGGERQRVAIARAILKDSPIILLDEALSSLDAENAVAIQKGIEEMIKGKTVFLVSHTLSYIQNSDQILVLSDGILQGCGKHEELLQTVPLYQTMWEKEKSIKNWKLA